MYLLEKLEVLLGKSSEDEIKTDVLPLVFNTLESNSLQGQVSQAVSHLNMNVFIILSQSRSNM